MSYLGYPPISPGYIDDTSLIVDGVIQTADIANSAITTAKLNDSSVTSDKLDTNLSIDGTLGVTGNLTASANLSVTGTTTLGTTTIAAATITGNLTVQGTTTTIDSATAQTIDLGDGDKIQLGADNDLQIYHDGSDSYVTDEGTGNMYVRSNGAGVIIANNANVTMARFLNNNAVDLYFNGNVKLATSSTGVTVTGDVDASNFNATSDVALKDNLALVENPLEKLSNISGYTFNWKKDNKEAVGIIAQEVEQIFPQLVTTGNDGYKRVNYDALIPIMIEAIKELSAKIK
jgi:hypothetical protein